MDKVKLYIIEEQELFREIYGAALSQESTIDLLGMSTNGEGEDIMAIISSSKPDVVLMGTKALQSSTVDKLEAVRDSYPEIALVLLSTVYDINGIKRLREFTRKSSKGCAFLLKHSIDRMSQLMGVIHSVTNGQVILDSMVMEGLIEGGERDTAFMKELTRRELEVLNWMAKGYRNSTIAEVLCLEGKTIERHINSIYSKLSGTFDARHPRVSSIILYLKATGQLPNDDFIRD